MCWLYWAISGDVLRVFDDLLHSGELGRRLNVVFQALLLEKWVGAMNVKHSSWRAISVWNSVEECWNRLASWKTRYWCFFPFSLSLKMYYKALLDGAGGRFLWKWVDAQAPSMIVAIFGKMKTHEYLLKDPGNVATLICSFLRFIWIIRWYIVVL